MIKKSQNGNVNFSQIYYDERASYEWISVAVPLTAVAIALFLFHFRELLFFFYFAVWSHRNHEQTRAVAKYAV